MFHSERRITDAKYKYGRFDSSRFRHFRASFFLISFRFVEHKENENV